MKNLIKVSLMIVMILVLSFLMPGLMDSTQYNIEAGEATFSEEETGSEGGSGSVGATDFLVLEILPYHGMGEIGYLVDGQEPIEDTLMNYDTAGGAVSFLGGAIDVYRSYAEKPVQTAGTPDTGWLLARSYEYQNGYFIHVGYDGTGRYAPSTGTNYISVANGTGTHKAVLGTMDSVYSGTWEPTNRKNVNAYFVYGKPAGVSLYSSSEAYEIYSVQEIENRTGDYDYAIATKSFVLNKGNGRYNVIFVKTSKSSNVYYMMNNYEIVDYGLGDYSFTVTYNAQSGGNYKINPSNTYYTYNRWNGTYRWVQDESALSKPNYSTDSNGRIWVQNHPVITEYQYKYNVKLINNEWFKTTTLGIHPDQVEDYNVKVITLTPAELNLTSNQHYIEEADLFYINTQMHNQNYLMLYENYNAAGVLLPAAEKFYNNNARQNAYLNYAVNDISWDNTIRLFRNIAGIGGNKAAVVVDTTFFINAIQGNGAYSSLSKSVSVSYTWNSNNATMCNMAKLYIMIYQRNMIDFYNSFLNPSRTTNLITQVNTSVNGSGTTGSFIRPDSTNPSATADAAIYWNGNTFVPYGLNGNGVMTRFTQDELYNKGIVNYNILATPYDLTDNILSIGGSGIFTSNFQDDINLPNDSKDKAVDHLSSLNEDGSIVDSRNITIGNLINVITNNGNGYENTGGVSYPAGGDVEGVPAEDPVEDEEDDLDDGLDGSGIRDYKRILNIQPTADFTASEAAIRSALSDYDLQVINMTSMQFNGSMEDINSRYDMVYLGSSAGRFNYSGGNTIFNETTLRNAIYYASGDSIYINNGTVNKVYYTTNDITTQKRSELQSFLNAGYPIVLDSGLYNLTNVKTTTNIYGFISGVKVSVPNNFINLANLTSSDTTTKKLYRNRLKYAFNIKRPYINLLQPLVQEGASVNYVYVDEVQQKLIIKFKIQPRGTVASGYLYNANLYIDENGNGLFEEEEQLNIIASNGSPWNNLSESWNKTYSYQYDMNGLNGVYQWKLLVERTDNTNIHSIVTGYTANTEKKNIYALQIRENNSAYNLENKVNDAVSLISQYAGTSRLTDYNIIFDTLTVQEFEQLYADEPYTTITALETDKLSRYHIIIFDNPTTAISDANGALANCKDEIAEDLSTIYTKGALGFSNQSSYYLSGKFSFLNHRTYNYINRYAPATYASKNQYYIYNSLSNNGSLASEATYQTTYLTKANEGTLTRYPYQLNHAIKIAANQYSEDITIDFNLLQNQKLIGWYCLSDAKSPVVRKAGLYNGGTNAELYQGMYSSSPNDVKNNYYLFSFGRCYYSGIKLEPADVTGNSDEMKLFVNTLIAAYKATTRIVSTPPVIEIIDPIPVGEEGLIKSIMVTTEDVFEGNFILTFKITDSSSPMDLTLLFDGLDPSGNWDDNIYEVIAGELSTIINVKNTDKLVDNKTYAIKIPITAIQEPHLLSIKASNEESSVTTESVTLEYNQTPQVTIIDPIPMINASKSYLYADIDFNALDTDEDYLNNAEELRVTFKVEKAIPNFTLTIMAGSENLTDGTGYDVAIYSAADLGHSLSPLTSLPNGEYVMMIPAALMKNVSSRDITITATTQATLSGQAAITLLRRSLFPLD